ncbi:MAG: alcohol dehydrogenase catalytic domain-containing protein [bacterium]
MADKMRAQVFYEPEKMKLEEVPVPKVEVDQILVRVKACGICGSDVAYYFGNSSLETETGKGPLILGHEFSGEVVEVGAIPKRLGLFAPGDRVVLDPVQYCNACVVCKRGQVNLCEKKAVLGVSTNGGFAEYCVSNYTGVHKIPDGVSYEQAALTEPLACAVYGVQNLRVAPGDFCVVMGPGVIGMMMLQLAKRQGAGTMVLTGSKGDDYRLEVGKELGAEVVINVSDPSSPYYVSDLKAKIEELSGGSFADAVITPTGAVEAMEAALQITGRRARIVYFGLPSDKAVIRVPALASILWDKTIRFSWLAPLTWPTALQALGTGLINTKPLSSHTMSLDDLIPGLANVRDRKDKVMKAIVIP